MLDKYKKILRQLVRDGIYEKEKVKDFPPEVFTTLITDKFPEALDYAYKFRKLVSEETVQDLNKAEIFVYVRELYDWKQNVRKWTPKEMREKNISKEHIEKKQKERDQFIARLLITIPDDKFEPCFLKLATGVVIEEVKRIGKEGEAANVSKKKKDLIEKYYKAEKEEQKRETLIDAIDIIQNEYPKESTAESYISNIKKKQREFFYSTDFVEAFWNNDFSIKWIGWYINVLCKDVPQNYDEIIIVMANHRFAGITTAQKTTLLEMLPEDKVCKLLSGIKEKEIQNRLIKDLCTINGTTDYSEIIIQFILDQSDLDGIISLLQKNDLTFGNKEAIKGKLNELLQNVGYDNVDELEKILDAFELINEDDTWLKDITFWKNLRNDLFSAVVNWIDEHYDFFELAYINMRIARIIGDNSLFSRWMECFVRMGISTSKSDEFQNIYRQMQKDPLLGERIISKTNAMIFDEAIRLKRAYDAELFQSEKAEKIIYEKILNTISAGISRIEEFVSDKYFESMDLTKYRDYLLHDLAELRRQMHGCMIDTVINPDQWEKGELVTYNPHYHKSDDEVIAGEKVLPLSMGIVVNNGNYREPAKVRKASERGM